MPHTYSSSPTIQKNLNYFSRERLKWAAHSRSGLLLLQISGRFGHDRNKRHPLKRERGRGREREQRRSRVSPPHSSSPALPSVEPPPSPAKPEPPPRHELAQSRHCHRPRAKLLRRRAGHKLTRSHRHRRFSCSSTTDVLAKLFDHLIQSADHLRHDVGEQKKLDLITIHCSCSNRSYRSQK
jgi:hypothetical protein